MTSGHLCVSACTHTQGGTLNYTDKARPLSSHFPANTGKPQVISKQLMNTLPLNLSKQKMLSVVIQDGEGNRSFWFSRNQIQSSKQFFSKRCVTLRRTFSNKKKKETHQQAIIQSKAYLGILAPFLPSQQLERDSERVTARDDLTRERARLSPQTFYM